MSKKMQAGGILGIASLAYWAVLGCLAAAWLKWAALLSWLDRRVATILIWGQDKKKCSFIM